MEAGKRGKKSLHSSYFFVQYSNVNFTKEFQTLYCRLRLSLDTRWQLQRFQMCIMDKLPIFISLKTGLVHTANSPVIGLLMRMNIHYSDPLVASERLIHSLLSQYDFIRKFQYLYHCPLRLTFIVLGTKSCSSYVG